MRCFRARENERPGPAWPLGALVGVALLGVLAEAGRTQAPTPASPLGARAEALLQRRCGNDSCHGTGGKNTFHVFDREEYIGTMVRPKDLANSALFRRAADGSMPPGQKLAPAEVALLREWVLAGAPPAAGGAAPKRPFIPEARVLDTILRDLEAASAGSRPRRRYISLVTLSNGPGVSSQDLEHYRNALSKLVNHLSWEKRIVRPQALDRERLIYRIDLADYGWDQKQWAQVVAAYPYGRKPAALSTQIQAIQRFSGSPLPYLEGSWFVANASVPPLYPILLRLPATLAELEKRLGVDAKASFRQDRLRRFGVSNSGVSTSNRVMDRYFGPFGPIWGSLDFADSRADRNHNIHANPVDPKPDGGEQIFMLPNQLFGYYLTDAAGKRLDTAPEKIVANKTDPLGPTVVLGRSCMGCHSDGLIQFADDLADAVALTKNQRLPAFNQDKAERLLGGQQEVRRWIGSRRELFVGEDNRRFRAALARTGSPLPEDASQEPISRLAQRHGGPLTLAQAAADVYFADAEQFRSAVRSSRELLQNGFLSLVGPTGQLKREVWEAKFPLLVSELRLGELIAPTRRPAPVASASGLLRVAVGEVTATDPAQAAAARTQLIYFLNSSRRLEVVKQGAQYTLTGRLTAVNGRLALLSMVDTRRGLREEATGPRADLSTVVEQVAHKVHFRLTGERLPSPPTGPGTPALGVSGRVAGLLQNAGGGNGLRVLVGVDRGPDATYHADENIDIFFKVDQDCYITLLNIDSTGKTTPLFPRQTGQSNFVKAGVLQRFRAQVDPKGNFGAEQVLAIAARKDLDLPGFKRKPDGSKSLVPVDKVPSAVIEDVQGTVSPSVANREAAVAAVRFFTRPK